MSRWQQYELIALDEVGYVRLADIGAEFLFQVGESRAGGDRCDDESAILGMDRGVSTGPHHRDGHGIALVSTHGGKEEEFMNDGGWFWLFRPGARYAQTARPPCS